MESLDSKYGVELDLRDGESDLIIHHDPFSKGELFDDYLNKYKHSTMILNIKSAGIELNVLEALSKRGIEDYFFLDCSYPMINMLTQMSCNKIALRFSEYERLDSIEVLASKVTWVWVDCFYKLHFTKSHLDRFKQLGLKSCLVSPDLIQKEEEITKYADYLLKNDLEFDAICCKTRNISLWKKLLGETS